MLPPDLTPFTPPSPQVHDPLTLLEDSLLEAAQHVFSTFTPLINSSHRSDPASFLITTPKISVIIVTNKHQASTARGPLSFPSLNHFLSSVGKVQNSVPSQNILPTGLPPYHISYPSFFVSFWLFFRLHLLFTL